MNPNKISRFSSVCICEYSQILILGKGPTKNLARFRAIEVYWRETNQEQFMPLSDKEQQQYKFF